MDNVFKNLNAKVGDKFINGEGYIVKLIGESPDESWYKFERVTDGYVYSVYKNGHYDDPNVNPLDICVLHERVNPQDIESDMESDHKPDEEEGMEAIYAYLFDMWKKKNHDYGNSFDDSLREFGATAGIVRMQDKFNRIKTLLKKDPKVNGEGIVDSFLDLANYAAMMARFLIDENQNTGDNE